MLKIKKAIPSFVFLLSLQLATPLCFAQSQFVFSPEAKSSKQWKKIEVEEWMRYRVTEAVERVIPEHRFYVDVRVNAAQTAARVQYRRRRVVRLDKFDMKLDLGGPRRIVKHLPKDLFKRIDSVEVDIVVEKQLSKAKQAVVREIPYKVLHYVRPSQVVVNLDRFQDGGPSLLAWLKQYQIILGMMAFAVFCSVMFFMAFLLVSRLGNRFLDVTANLGLKILERNKADDSQPPVAGSSSYAKTRVADTSFKQTPVVVTDFIQLLHSSQEHAVHLIRQWIKVDSRAAREALKLLANFLPAEGVIDITSRLYGADLEKWREITGRNADDFVPEVAEEFITTEMESRHSINSLKDNRIKKALVSMTPEDAAAIAKIEPELGALLLDYLPPQKMARMLSIMDQGLVQSLTKYSSDFDLDFDEELRVRLLELATQVRKERQDGTPSVLKKAIHHLPEIGPENEGAIFDTMAESGRPQLLRQAAEMHFPAEMIVELPAGLLKNGMMSMSLDDLVVLSCYSQEYGLEKIPEAVGMLGQKINDYVRVQVKEHLKQADGEEVSREYNRVYRQFVENVRVYLKSNEEAAKVAKGYIEKWLKQRYRKKDDGSAA